MTSTDTSPSARGEDLKARLRLRDVGRDLEPLDELRRARLDENRLPNSARAAVPAPLFADRLLVIIHRIFDPEHERAAELAIAFAR